MLLLIEAPQRVRQATRLHIGQRARRDTRLADRARSRQAGGVADFTDRDSRWEKTPGTIRKESGDLDSRRWKEQWPERKTEGGSSLTDGNQRGVDSSGAVRGGI